LPERCAACFSFTAIDYQFAAESSSFGEAIMIARTGEVRSRSAMGLAVATICFAGHVPAQATAQTVTALAWEANHPERVSWSTELRTQFSNHLSDFAAASDLADFCPKYQALSDPGKIEALATLAVAIAKYESNYNPKQHFGEPPPLGYDSIGLFQLSYEDGFSWCVLDRSAKSLEDPINNIRCAVPEMARLVKRDERLAGGSSLKDAKGLGHYWSVVWQGPKHYLAAIKTKTESLGLCAK
jgi:hypothetical protein